MYESSRTNKIQGIQQSVCLSILGLWEQNFVVTPGVHAAGQSDRRIRNIYSIYPFVFRSVLLAAAGSANKK